MSSLSLTRRAAVGGLGAAALTGCGVVPQPRGETTFAPAPNPQFEQWKAAFRTRVVRAGLSPTTLTAFDAANFLPGVVARDRNQVEFRRSLEDYLALVASPDDVALGRRRVRGAARALSDIEAALGVDAPVLAAIWGVETAFGTVMGSVPVLSATATLAFDGRRARFFASEVMAALRIVESGDIAASRMTGSWAGAMGHTQLMPSSYQTYAVDFRGDGRREVWGRDPTDALAATAQYLRRFGWVEGAPWGVEVRLPEPGARRLRSELRAARSVEAWQNAGLRRADGAPLRDYGPARLYLAEGAPGAPAFLLFRNFDVIRRYNPSTSYAIGVGHLADRLAGGGPLLQSFGTDATGLTHAGRRRLQRGLTGAGFPAGPADGVIGMRTEAAIRAYQRANGLTPTGVPSPELLARVS